MLNIRYITHVHKGNISQWLLPVVGTEQVEFVIFPILQEHNMSQHTHRTKQPLLISDNDNIIPMTIAVSYMTRMYLHM